LEPRDLQIRIAEPKDAEIVALLARITFAETFGYLFEQHKDDLRAYLDQTFAVNKIRRSRVRSFVRKVEEALAAGDKTAAEAAFNAAQPELMRAAGKGVLHRNTASRKVSRLAQRVKGLSA